MALLGRDNFEVMPRQPIALSLPEPVMLAYRDWATESGSPLPDFFHHCLKMAYMGHPEITFRCATYLPERFDYFGFYDSFMPSQAVIDWLYKPNRHISHNVRAALIAYALKQGRLTPTRPLKFHLRAIAACYVRCTDAGTVIEAITKYWPAKVPLTVDWNGPYSVEDGFFWKLVPALQELCADGRLQGVKYEGSPLHPCSRVVERVETVVAHRRRAAAA